MQTKVFFAAMYVINISFLCVSFQSAMCVIMNTFHVLRLKNTSRTRAKSAVLNLSVSECSLYESITTATLLLSSICVHS